MPDFEKLGQFYLGKRYDLQRGAVGGDLVLYDAKDLMTHAVCVGMTGSGKTGLSLALLEEAAIDGIPALAIDPKGDLGNLLLTFPQLRADDFLPWVDVGEATRQGRTPGEQAAQVADLWRRGLADWDQTPERIEKFRSAVDLAIYTPGSQAGLPLAVLQSFAPPGAAVAADADALRDRILAAASGLLALLGIEADPVRNREHILLSNLLDRAWRAGETLDVATLLRQIQNPPLERVGFLDLETFYPAAERFALAMQLNNLLASPGFLAWLEGEPLDVGRLLYTRSGRPRLSIVSIAHLSDSQRMFFVTLLLNEVLAWVRSQPGTSSLRAILYMDEVFGYFPPTANPPSKLPMLTLLKQARAFGLGVVLATQNPVDLDYKGLSNAGTWFIGRLQTERDKLRVLDGLEGASAAAGATFDRQRLEQTLSALRNRVFLMNNVHEDEPVVFQTRWALSYLRGPLTRGQIEALMRPRKTAAAEPAASQTAAPPGLAVERPALAGEQTTERPVVPPGIAEVFVAARQARPADTQRLYRPALLGTARLHFVDNKADLDTWRDVTLLQVVGGDFGANPWQNAERSGAVEYDSGPGENAAFDPLPASLLNAKNYASWRSSLKDHLYREFPLELLACPKLGLKSRPDESEGEFRIRLTQTAHEQRDLAIEKLRAKYSPKLKALQDRLRRADQRVATEQEQYQQQSLQAAVTFGTSVLGALFGRKLASSANVTRAGSSARAASRAARERGDIGRAQENRDALQQELNALDADFQGEIARMRGEYDIYSLEVVPYPVRPRKSDLAVEQVVLAWMPWFLDASGQPLPAS